MNTDVFLNQMAEVLQVEPSELNPELSLNEGNFDSLALISTISLLDENFGITVNVDRLMGCQKIQDLLDLVSEKFPA